MQAVTLTVGATSLRVENVSDIADAVAGLCAGFHRETGWELRFGLGSVGGSERGYQCALEYPGASNVASGEGGVEPGGGGIDAVSDGRVEDTRCCGEPGESACGGDGGVVGGRVESGRMGSSVGLSGSVASARVARLVAGSGGGKRLPRGPNFERNQRNREAKRRSKARNAGVGEQSSVESAKVASQEPLEWRRAAGGTGVTTARGYFSECSSEVQRKLRESRAEMLVAENAVKAELARKKLAHLSSPEQTLRDLQRVVGLGKKIGRAAGATPIAGWAETIVDSAVRSVGASSTSVNKLPELTEIGVGRSLSVDSSNAAAAELKVPTPRELEYQAARALVERRYEELDAYHPDEYIEALEDVRREYGDVVYPPGEWKLRKQLLAVADAAMDFHNIDDLRNAVAAVAYKDDDVKPRNVDGAVASFGCW